MPDAVLVYPYFRPPHDKSIFRFPPLGLGYIASYLRENGVSVEIVDCTFRNEREVISRIRKLNSSVIGIYSMFTMENNSLKLARLLRENCDLLAAGGPFPSIYPEMFLQDFDVAVMGEGEQTMLEIIKSLTGEIELSKIPGIAYKKSVTNEDDAKDEIVRNPQRKPISNLDSLPLPARDFFDNEDYKAYYKRIYGYTVTSIMSSRGCPFKCDFCSKPVFGELYRERSAENVVDEIEDVLSFGYERVFFQDDCFTLNERRVRDICEEILQRRLQFDWDCLSRVDSVNQETLSKMKTAGCKRIFFGIESGDNSILKIMKKQVTIEQARRAVELTASMGIKTGAFFILGYPEETDETILNTIRFATSLPLDYLSFSLPYPIPGTGLNERVKSRLKNPSSLNASIARRRFIDHTLNFQSPFSEAKLKFAIVKAMAQHKFRKRLGNSLYTLLGKPFETLTDHVFKTLK